MDINKRIYAVDRQLHQMANQYVDKDFVHPDANLKPLNDTAQSAKMKTVKQMVRATKMSIDVHRPCGDNHGHGLILVVIVYNRINDFERRKTIRNTFGSVLKRNAKSVMYFIVARHSDSG